MRAWWRARPVLRRTVITAASFTALLGLGSAALIGLAYAHFNGQLHRVSVLQRHDKSIRDAGRQAHAENFLVIGSGNQARTCCGSPATRSTPTRPPPS